MTARPAAAVVAPDVVGAPVVDAQRLNRIGAIPSRPTGLLILIAAAVLFLIPLAAMAVFSFQSVGTDAFTLAHYASLFDPAQESTYDGLFQGIQNSLIICGITLLIVLLFLLPAMLLAELRYPRVKRALEFVCLLPITVPTVVLVVGFVPVYQVVQSVLGSDPWTLAFAIGVIVLPYAYRPIQANLSTINVITLTEAARSLGAGPGRAVFRVIIPNLRRGLISGGLLTISVVLGEFTIANFLGQNTFQTALLLLQQTDPYLAVICALVALLFVFALLVIISTVGGIGQSRRARR